MTENLTRKLAVYATSTSCVALPIDVQERVKQVIFDELACAYFSRHSLAGDLAARYAASAGGAAEARIYASGQRVSAIHAALANGAAGHGDEVDGAHVVGGHPGASIVHAAAAMAQRQRATGAEFMNAVVLGYDVGVRVLEACGGVHGIKKSHALHGDFLYTMGCAAAASRLLGLDAPRHGHALALSSFAANGLWSMYAEQRHISKSLCNGQYAAAGISAALMAAAGLEGHEDILGAPHGVLHAWGQPDGRGAVTRGLGESYAIMGANFKFMNAGYPIHSPVEAALTLVATHGIALDDIESIYVGLPTNVMRVVDSRDMHNICLQDVLSAALVQGGFKLRGSPFPHVLAEPAFKRLRPLVALHGDEVLDREQPSGRGAIVAITTQDGAKVSLRIEHPRGHSQRGGATWDELMAKWHEGLPECNVDRIVALARRMEELDDAAELVDAFQS